MVWRVLAQTRISINEPGRGIFAGASDGVVALADVGVTAAETACPAGAVFET